VEREKLYPMVSKVPHLHTVFTYTMFACFLFGSALAYNLVMMVYRLHFHSLSRYPGPRLAAATGLYEIYFSLWGPGFFENEIDQMHQKYGSHTTVVP
jgi:hypothetical protein